MRLLLADDHVLFRDAMVHYIERTYPNAIVMLAQDVPEVMESLAAQADVDLVLLDFQMPGMNGFEGLRRIRTVYPDIPVALMSGVAEKEDVEKAFTLGIRAYLPKTLSGKMMLGAIQRVLNGEKYIPRTVGSNELMPSYYDYPVYDQSAASERAVHEPDLAVVAGKPSAADPFASLTPRERVVLEHLTTGASNQEIADDLGLQIVTIKLHIRSICRKLNAKNRTQAALIAQQRRLSQ